MKNIFTNLWRQEEGAETAEWLVIVALIVLVGIAVYQGVLQTELTNLVGTIGGILGGVGGP